MWTLILLIHGSTGYGGPVTIDEIPTAEVCQTIAAQAMEETPRQTTRGLFPGRSYASVEGAWCVNPGTGETFYVKNRE